MAHSLAELSDEALRLLSEYHLGTLTTLRADGSPHVTAAGFTVDRDAGCARVITNATSQKAVNAGRGCRAVVANVEGRHWISLEGRADVRSDPEAIAEAERRYAERYRVPRPNPTRVVVVIDVDRVLGSASMFAPVQSDSTAKPHNSTA